jgi:hypothetical protein
MFDEEKVSQIILLYRCIKKYKESYKGIYDNYTTRTYYILRDAIYNNQSIFLQYSYSTAWFIINISYNIDLIEAKDNYSDFINELQSKYTTGNSTIKYIIDDFVSTMNYITGELKQELPVDTYKCIQQPTKLNLSDIYNDKSSYVVCKRNTYYKKRRAIDDAFDKVYKKCNIESRHHAMLNHCNIIASIHRVGWLRRKYPVVLISLV